MSRVDMFCAGDDRHRVALLEDLLQQAGQSVVLHSSAPEGPSDPCIVACTSRALKKPWIVELFSSGVAVVALRLDDTPLPGPCSRVIDLQSWPARSADRHVGALVDWLIQYGHGSSGAAAGRAPDPGASDDGLATAAVAGSGRQQAANPGRAGFRRQRPRRGASEARRVLIILGILLLGGVLIWSSAPERGKDRAGGLEETAAAAPLDGAPMPQPDSGDPPPAEPAVPAAAGSAGSPAATGPAAAGTTASVAEAGRTAITVDADVIEWITDADTTPLADADAGAAAATSAAVRASGDVESALPPVDVPAPRPATVQADALAHLCAAGSLRAARAWAAALNWKQRRRAMDEPCVARLLARPGYRTLEPLLGRP